jgi:hypothetical protein
MLDVGSWTLQKIKDHHYWDTIVDSYGRLFLDLVGEVKDSLTTSQVESHEVLFRCLKATNATKTLISTIISYYDGKETTDKTVASVLERTTSPEIVSACSM